MTGREMILYILENHLEDEPMFKDGKITGFMTVEEAALIGDVGIETINILCKLNNIPYININGINYIPCNVKKEEDKYG